MDLVETLEEGLKGPGCTEERPVWLVVVVVVVVVVVTLERVLPFELRLGQPVAEGNREAVGEEMDMEEDETTLLIVVLLLLDDEERVWGDLVLLVAVLVEVALPPVPLRTLARLARMMSSLQWIGGVAYRAAVGGIRGPRLTATLFVSAFNSFLLDAVIITSADI
ncbi:hypothetical protein CVT26_001673 [Gymnopilus dilepis]|uniref:Uncharacterized protein n=1 Tax=Gymnopilus dilepis TaxID=231916 RepID=A0A409WB65_9AGAR|nr:hypothetical protein CVT26_001673 [Gymnopilus dilepis]